VHPLGAHNALRRGYGAQFCFCELYRRLSRQTEQTFLNQIGFSMNYAQCFSCLYLPCIKNELR